MPVFLLPATAASGLSFSRTTTWMFPEVLAPGAAAVIGPLEIASPLTLASCCECDAATRPSVPATASSRRLDRPVKRLDMRSLPWKLKDDLKGGALRRRDPQPERRAGPMSEPARA